MSEKIPDDVMQDIREQFSAFDLDGNGHITSSEIGNVMKSLGEEIPGYKLREIINEVDKNRNGTVEFDEFMEIYKKTSSRVQSHQFKQLVQKRQNLNVAGGTSESSAEGTKHSFSDAERAAFADWINSQLAKDPDCKSYLDIHPESNTELFEKLKDGIILCKMINLSAPTTIDERAINKGKLNAFLIHENQLLVVNSAGAIGCTVVNIGAEDLVKGKSHLMLGLLWQIIRIGLFAHINLGDNPNIAALLRDGETMDDLLRLSPEELLLRWVNYHLEKAGSDKRIHNFSGDISSQLTEFSATLKQQRNGNTSGLVSRQKEAWDEDNYKQRDSEAYAILLNRIAPQHDIDDPNLVMGIGDHTKRAEAVLRNADKINCRRFVRAKDIVAGNPKLNLAFVANLFNNFPALELEEGELEEMEPYEETREEKTFRNWMNSLGVNPFVNHLYNDVNNGMILFQLFDSIKKGHVNWEKVNKPPYKAMGGRMKKIENCNYAVELGHKMNFSLVGIGGEDIFNGTRTLTLGLVWQMMRAYTLSLLQKLTKSEKPITEKEIVDWVNQKLSTGGKSTKIGSMKDPTICNSLAIIDLIDVIKTKSIDYEIVTEGNTDEEKMLNAQYAVSMCRKIGARTYALPEDIVEVKPKMILTVFACLMTRALGSA